MNALIVVCAAILAADLETPDDLKFELRLLADRRDAAVIPPLRKMLADNHDQLALESLWAVNLRGGLDEATALADS